MKINAITLAEPIPNTIMSHYLVTAALDGPTHAEFIVEADSEDEAERNVTSDEPRTNVRYNGHHRIEHTLGAHEISEEEAEKTTSNGIPF